MGLSIRGLLYGERTRLNVVCASAAASEIDKSGRRGDRCPLSKALYNVPRARESMLATLLGNSRPGDFECPWFQKGLKVGGSAELLLSSTGCKACRRAISLPDQRLTDAMVLNGLPSCADEDIAN